MGRYYYTDSGVEGKFMFGVQPSDDPEVMGMHEQDRSSIDYYADEHDVEDITKKLNEQYDLLGVEDKDRLYLVPRKDDGTEDYKAYSEWESSVLHDKVWYSVHRDSMTEEQKKATHWTSPRGDDYVDIEVGKEKCLALARVRLALDILTDIKYNGYCSLNAEI